MEIAMLRRRCLIALALGVLMALPVYAQRKSLGTRVAALAAPLGADEALLIGRIDTSKIDVPAALDWAAKAMKVNEDERAQMEKGLQEPRTFLQGFRDAGGQEMIWLVFPTPGPGREPIDVAGIVTTAPGKAKEVAAFLRQAIPKDRFEVTDRGDTVVIASAERTRKYDGSAKASETIAKAFDAAGEGTAQAVLQLSDDTRRVVRETLPRLPEEFGGVSGKELGDAFSWAALSIDAPPKLKLKLQIQATSAEGAKSLATVMGNWYKIAGSPAEIKEAIPGFEELLPLFTPKANGDQVVLSLGEKPGEIDRLLPVIVAPLQAARAAARRSQQMNTLKQLGLAMHNYHDTHKAFPPQTFRDKAGKPLLSWRVHVLPYIEENDLYKQFHLDEPWDSEHNKKLVEKMPKIYEDTRVPGVEKGKTTFVVPVGKDTIFGGTEGMKITKISDGTSNTIMVLESDAKHAVTWTKPDDIDIDPKEPARGLFGDERKQILALFADGSVRALPLPKLGENLYHMLTASGGEVINSDF
jgi:hypothetical protein